jgi:hypothetical protein
VGLETECQRVVAKKDVGRCHLEQLRSVEKMKTELRKETKTEGAGLGDGNEIEDCVEGKKADLGVTPISEALQLAFGGRSKMLGVAALFGPVAWINLAAATVAGAHTANGTDLGAEVWEKEEAEEIEEEEGNRITALMLMGSALAGSAVLFSVVLSKMQEKSVLYFFEYSSALIVRILQQLLIGLAGAIVEVGRRAFFHTPFRGGDPARPHAACDEKDARRGKSKQSKKQAQRSGAAQWSSAVDDDELWVQDAGADTVARYARRASEAKRSAKKATPRRRVLPPPPLSAPSSFLRAPSAPRPPLRRVLRVAAGLLISLPTATLCKLARCRGGGAFLILALAAMKGAR